jgi:hypothetical protein
MYRTKTPLEKKIIALKEINETAKMFVCSKKHNIP